MLPAPEIQVRESTYIGKSIISIFGRNKFLGLFCSLCLTNSIVVEVFHQFLNAKQMV